MNLRAVLPRALGFDYVGLYAASKSFARAPASFDLIAIGKAAGPIAESVLDSWGNFRAGVVVLPDGAPAPRPHPRLEVFRASHPLPDARSVVAGEAALSLAQKGEGSLLQIEVSGGASSLAAVPIEGVTLESFRAVTAALLASGADVRAINVVRRHLSRVHGGGLARAAFPRRVDTSIVSDVIGGAPHDVGSGPGSPDPTTIEDARRVLAQYGPAFRDLPLEETLKPADAAAAHVESTIVLEPNFLADEIAHQLEEAGYAPRVLAPSTANVEQLASDYCTQARLLAPGEAIVRTAEPSVEVTVPHPGSGGRSTHLAALVARDLPPGVEFMAAASDGVDGSSETGGAIVDARSFRKRRDALEVAIAAFDTGPLHRAYGTALPAGPTGLNFADVHVLLRAKD